MYFGNTLHFGLLLIFSSYSSAALLEPTSNLAITPAYSARSGEYTAEKLAALKKNAISLVNTDLSSVKDEDLMTPQEEAELNRQRFAAASATAGASSSAPINIDEDQGENPAAAEPRDEVDVLIMKKIKAQQKTSAGGDEKQVTEEGPDRVLPTQDQIKRARQKRERARQFPGNGGEGTSKNAVSTLFKVDVFLMSLSSLFLCGLCR